MPVSSIDNLYPVASFVRDLSPARVLDVGIGFGLYGALCRQILDIAEGRYARDTWKASIIGVEAFAQYRTPLWDFVYDRVEIGTAPEVLDRVPPADLAILCDVIEHLTKDAGMRLVETLLNKAEAVVVSTPLVFMNDPNSYTEMNDKEQHLSLWEEKDFRPWVRATRLTSMTGIFLLSRRDLNTRPGFHSSDGYQLRRILRNQLPDPMVQVIRRIRRAL